MKIKKILSVLLAAVLAVGTMAVSVSAASALDIPFDSDTIEATAYYDHKNCVFYVESPPEFSSWNSRTTWGEFKKNYSNITISDIMYTDNSEGLNSKYIKIKAFIRTDDYETFYSNEQTLSSNSKLVWNYKNDVKNCSNDTDVWAGYVITIDDAAFKNMTFDGSNEIVKLYINQNTKYRTISGTRKLEEKTYEGQKYIDTSITYLSNDTSGSISESDFVYISFEKFSKNDKISVTVAPKNKNTDTSKWQIDAMALSTDYKSSSYNSITGKMGVLKLETTFGELIKLNNIPSLSTKDLSGIQISLFGAAKNNEVNYSITFSPASGTSSSSSSSSSSASSKLPAPSGFKAKATKSSLKITWNEVSGADAYRVYMYNSKTGKYEKYKDVGTAQCTVTGLKSGTKYKFKVVALDKQNGKYTAGTSSPAFSVTTK